MGDHMILRAKFLMPSADHVIENGAVAVHGGVITAVGEYHAVSRTAAGPARDLGEAALIPGLINAHTHLELTGLRRAVPFQGSFVDWLMRVREVRNAHGFSDLRDGSRLGAAESARSGTTAVGDYTQTRASFEPLRLSRLRGVAFLETVGFPPKVALARSLKVRWSLWRAAVNDLLRMAVSPHAPYSVSADLYLRLSRIARSRGLIFSTHLNESPEEIEFFEKGTGPFRERLAQRGILWDGWRPPGTCPLRYLDSLGILDPGALLIHCNYLSDGDIEILAARRAAVVFCPRSHAFFQHKDHPFEKLIAKGVTVSLGTDSLASNDSLSILDEMRFVAANHPRTSPREILRMATANGAECLRLSDRVGRLREGLQADLTAVSLPPFTKDPFEGMMSSSAKPIYTMVAGQALYDFSSPVW